LNVNDTTKITNRTPQLLENQKTTAKTTRQRSKTKTKHANPKHNPEGDKQLMDEITQIMFILTFIVGFAFTFSGFNDLKEALKDQKNTPALGFVYFIIALAVWIMIGMYWPVAATDTVLASLGWLWLGLGIICVALAITCAVLSLKAIVHENAPHLEIRQEERY